MKKKTFISSCSKSRYNWGYEKESYKRFLEAFSQDTSECKNIISKEINSARDLE